MLAAGGVFVVAGAFTVIVTDLLPVLPPESVALAVIVCVPLVNVREKLPPVPIWPLRLEVQISFEVKSPSSTSEALPEKLMVAPEAKDALFAGLDRKSTRLNS